MPEAPTATTMPGAPFRLPRMRGRDPHEPGRTASPLELIFDLTFAVSVGVAASQLAELTAQGHPGPGVLGFVFAMFAILVGWINFSWFASAFDTDDWAYRLCTMVQMVGVVILALGLPTTFASIEHGEHVDIRLLVLGYVVMRVGMLLLWLRAAGQSERHRRVCLRNAASIVIIQVAWVVVGVIDLGLVATFVLIVALGILELLIPVLTQGHADGTPWHPHHIAERYSAFAIITLGEGIVGTVASSRGALAGGTALDPDAVLVILAGIGMTFAMWWLYFLAPFGLLLQHRPRRGYLFGYGHIPVLLGIAGTGAGLHGAGLFLTREGQLGPSGVTLAVAAPVALYLVSVFALHDLFASQFDPFHLFLLGLTLVVLAGAVGCSAAGLPVAGCLLVVMLATFIPVIGYETIGHRRHAEALRAITSA